MDLRRPAPLSVLDKSPGPVDVPSALGRVVTDVGEALLTRDPRLLAAHADVAAGSGELALPVGDRPRVDGQRVAVDQTRQRAELHRVGDEGTRPCLAAQGLA